MLLRLYSSYHQVPLPNVKINDEEMTHANGHAREPRNARIPSAADRQAQDAEEFELEGLMSEDDEPLNQKANGEIIRH